MSSETSGPPQRDFDAALRDALRLAAESVEPGADGLDRIRSKIVARPARRGVPWRSVGVRRGGTSVPREALRLSAGWLATAFDAVLERFRPDPSRAGWFGWLRPAAAIATGLFVVTAASFAVAALPSGGGSTSSSGALQTSPSPRHHSRSVKSVTSYPSTGNSGVVNPGGAASHPAGTASCSPTPTGSPSTSPSGSPSPSSPTTSSTATPSPSNTTPAAGSGTPSDSPSPSSSADPLSSPSVSPSPEVSPESTGKSLLSPDAAEDAAGAVQLPGSADRGTGSLRPAAETTPDPSPSATPAPSPVPSATVTPQPPSGSATPCP